MKAKLYYYRGMDKETNSIPPNAFFVIEGGRTYPLVKTVINIGRGLENQLVIGDLRVSRNHARLQAINGQFALFDLNSKGGTFVNGRRIHQLILHPGDTISLGGLTLFFKQEDSPPRPDLIDTVR